MRLLRGRRPAPAADAGPCAAAVSCHVYITVSEGKPSLSPGPLGAHPPCAGASLPWRLPNGSPWTGPAPWGLPASRPMVISSTVTSTPKKTQDMAMRARLRPDPGTTNGRSSRHYGSPRSTGSSASLPLATCRDPWRGPWRKENESLLSVLTVFSASPYFKLIESQSVPRVFPGHEKGRRYGRVCATCEGGFRKDE